jgi:uroporphyrinogen-III synthase
MRVLVTRPEEDFARTAALLAAHGHQAVAAPLFAVRGLPAAMPAGADAVLAASANALRMADPAALRPFAGLPLLAVGGRTAEAARTTGFSDVTRGEGDAEGLARLVRERIPAGSRLLHLAGRPRRDAAIRALSGDYALVVAETYETVAVDALPAAAAAALSAAAVDAVLHLSPRAASVFADLTARAGLAAAVRTPIHVFISEAARDPRLPPGRVAARPDIESVVAAL